jgi:hypothetical protein
MISWIRHRAPYLTLVVAIVFAFGGVKHDQDLQNRETARLSALIIRTCKQNQKQWDIDNTQVQIITSPSKSASNDPAIIAQINYNNTKKLLQRKLLITAEGSRPKC